MPNKNGEQNIARPNDGTRGPVGQVWRPPVVAVLGHIDHGKSTLLDYIRKTNIVAEEAGGITQRLSAYEVVHKGEDGKERKITFLDTPGHEAFSKMRERGASAADIAILVVSAEDSVKAQTVEALETIKRSGIPFIVAINKIDKPGANPEKTKMDLLEKEVYLEGYGGNVPYVEISAKAGTRVNELLDLILLSADLANLEGNLEEKASGVVIESHLDKKRGISATLVIKNGTIKKGMFVVAGNAMTGTRILENFMGKPADLASFSSPIQIIGWNKIPPIGEKFSCFESKKEAEKAAQENQAIRASAIQTASAETEKKAIPIILKADASGSIEALEKEISKITSDTAFFKIISKGVGSINENDVKTAGTDKNSIILGFNVSIDTGAREVNLKMGITIEVFDIIYKMIEWLGSEMEKRRPKQEVEEVIGKAKIMKTFSQTKDKQVIGGKVLEGKLLAKSNFRIWRRENEVGLGRIVTLEKNRVKSDEVESPSEFGTMVESKIDIAPGDVLETFIFTTK
jgi:translation initiation factor IF-2